MDWRFPYGSIRLPVLAANCVATTQPLAAQAGIWALARGGNAVDAAIAAAVALTVVEPTMNGIGGDAFAIVWDGTKLTGINASGRAPAGWDPAAFTGPTMPSVGWDSVTIPGAVSGWMALHERYGTLPLDVLFEPAIRYATDGFLVPAAIARIWARQVERLRHQPGFADAFLPNGRAPLPGELFRCADQARTLRLIAESRGDAFYRGELAEAICHASAAAGGRLSLADFSTHRPDWVTPLSVRYRDVDVHEIPPNGQGIAALIALGILDRLDTDGLDPDGAEMQHLRIEATKVGLTDARAHVADIAFMRAQPKELLDPTRLDHLATSISRSAAAVTPLPSTPGRGTVYLAAADASGMAISFIQSNYQGFGSGVVVPGTGIALHNRGLSFSTAAGHPNRVGPGKRPLNTIIPGFVTRGGAALAPFGVMGGMMQPQGHVQMVTRMFGARQNPQAAIDAPRWRSEMDGLWVEASMPEATRDGLTRRGHRLITATDLDFGAAQIIHRLDHGWLGASESRRDGCALGF
jgi:gamma-glutamyltranspeptidase/glutathione hydrolase